MERLKLVFKEKLAKSENLRSAFETVDRNANEETLYQSQNDLYDALINDAAHMKELQGNLSKRTSDLSIFVIPKILTRMNDMNCSMQWGVHDKARSELFMRREVEYIYLQQINMDILYDRFFCNSTEWRIPPPELRGAQSYFMDRIITFEAYQKVVHELRHYLIVRHWLTPKLFMRLAGHDNGGRVSICSILDYITRKLDNYQFRLELFPYDINGKGYLTKEQFNLYLQQKLSMEDRNWTANGGKQYPLNKFYVGSFVTEIFFLLDPHRSGKLRMIELLDSRLLPRVRQNFSERVTYDRFMRKLAAFIEMDEDGQELISVPEFFEKFPELSQEIWGSDDEKKFLEPFLKRMALIYGNKSLDQGKISFETFMELTLACENLGMSLSSICYFFRILDTDGKGYLNQMDLQYHYRNIQDYINNEISCGKQRKYKLIKFANVQSQIGDVLAREGGLNRITPEKLHKIRGGHSLIEYLIDAEASLEKQDDYNQQHAGDEHFPPDETNLPFTNSANETGYICPATIKTNVSKESSVCSNIVMINDEGQGDVLVSTNFHSQI